MPNIAILIGNSDYRSLTKLDCCRADVAAMKELVDTTEKYDTVEIIENAEANNLKAKIRAVIDKAKSPAELFSITPATATSTKTNFFIALQTSIPADRTIQGYPPPTYTPSCASLTQTW